jgi:hypothetical protein
MLILFLNIFVSNFDFDYSKNAQTKDLFDSKDS